MVQHSFVIQHAEFSSWFTVANTTHTHAHAHTHTPPWSLELLFRSQGKQEILIIPFKKKTGTKRY